MRENTDRNNSEYGYFLHSVLQKNYSKKILQNDLQEFRLFFVLFVVDFYLVFSDFKTFFKIASEAATGGVL